MVNFGLLAAEIIWLVWGTPGNFNGFRVLAALLVYVKGVFQHDTFTLTFTFTLTAQGHGTPLGHGAPQSPIPRYT